MFEVCASSNAPKNKDETQIVKSKMYFTSTGGYTSMRAANSVFRTCSDERNIFMETEAARAEKTTTEISENETLAEECKGARNNNKGKIVKR